MTLVYSQKFIEQARDAIANPELVADPNAVVRVLSTEEAAKAARREAIYSGDFSAEPPAVDALPSP